MANLQIDLSGINGLVERYQGDLSKTTSAPNLRYLGAAGQMADGIYNPYKMLGFMSPANNVFTALTGTISAPIVSAQYDSPTDTLFLAENSANVLQLSGLDDTSVSNYVSLSSGLSIDDMLIYELNGKKALIYAIDNSNTTEFQIGYRFLNDADYTILEDNNVILESGTIAYLAKFKDAASENVASSIARKLGQQFNSNDLSDYTVSGLRLALSREDGTGAGITIKVSIQTNASPSTSPFTSRGAWSNAVTNYAINDTVTNGGFTWQCIQAHSAAATANDEPGVGTAWQDYWNRFGAPSGTELVSQTFSLTELSNLDETSDERYQINFPSIITLTPNTLYWIVIEESGTNMTASDSLSWLHTVNGTATTTSGHTKLFFSATSRWKDYNVNGDRLTVNHDVFDVQVITNQNENLSNQQAVGAFDQVSGAEQFLHLSDNALVYWVVDNKVHTLDGSIVGGELGKVVQNVLQFPSYINVVDMAETRSRLYIGIQTSARTIPSTASGKDYKYFPANSAGVFVWDRRSQVVGGTDYVLCPGAKEIKALFTGHDGSVYAITESNTGFGELRGLNGNQYEVIHTFDRFGFPRTRRSVQKVGSTMVHWVGANGIIYAYGVVAPGADAALYKVGYTGSGIDTDVKNGILFIGNEESSEPRLAAIVGVDSGLKKWYPNGEGTISSVVQTGNQGNVYTKVQLLPPFTNLRHINIYGAPTTSTASDTIATVKVYLNMSSTPVATKTITKKDMNKGYYEMQINRHNVHAVQLEIEWSTSETLGVNTFCPFAAVLDYDTPDTSGGKSS